MSALLADPQKKQPEEVQDPRVGQLVSGKDTAGLIRLLASKDPVVQGDAQRALAGLGPDAFDPLVLALGKKNRMIRMGVIGALAGTGDPRAVPFLALQLKDPASEVRWQAAIALGGIADPGVIPYLEESLGDTDKYVRFSSAVSLIKAGWEPGNSTETARYCAGLQDWSRISALGADAVPAIAPLVRDRDHDVRINAVKTLGAIGDASASATLLGALADPDPAIRWEAARAADRCGIPRCQMPRALYQRPRNTKSPLIAGFLNFILPGLGYGYIGRWWGIMIFQIDITATVWLYKAEGESNTYQLLLPLYLILAVHAWYITRKMGEEPP